MKEAEEAEEAVRVTHLLEYSDLTNPSFSSENSLPDELRNKWTTRRDPKFGW